eukprot:m51a1_g4984 putative transforming growth factor beta-1-induced transcript 1 protein isoform x2 (187) ;mRNA; r:77633-78490
MAVVCSGCNEEIVAGEVLTAFGMHWHPNHLLCAVCGKDFSDGSKCMEGPDGYAYCTADYEEAFTPKCAGCQKPIEASDAKVEAMDAAWHNECFKCPRCAQPFEGMSFFPGDDGLPYCERHYYEKMGMFCCVCEMPITGGKRIRVGELSFHPEHFCCSFCKRNLAGLQYKSKNGKPFCVKCHTQLYG